MVPLERQLHNIYEINTAVYLERLSRRYGRDITLATIPDQELDNIASFGMDSVWLMGIWKRSELAAHMSLQDKGLVQEVHNVLPDFAPQDMIGSAYSIATYRVDERFGGAAELATLRERLRARGMKLLLDFVPNHTGFDHEWTTSHPEYYVKGTFFDRLRHPSWYRKVQRAVIARGRDPHFEPWPDVAQLNAFSEAYRHQSIETLSAIAAMCDGVRCDMAMLMTNSVFSRTWPHTTPLQAEYWQDVITGVRMQSADFIFIAECYWNMEQALIAQGFDYCYDKDLYDCLVDNNLPAAQSHMTSVAGYSDHLVYFLENHDEPRIASILEPMAHATALHFLTQQPGVKLWHDGEFEGYHVKVPVHIGRGPAEASNSQIAELYRQELMRS